MGGLWFREGFVFSSRGGVEADDGSKTAHPRTRHDLKSCGFPFPRRFYVSIKGYVDVPRRARMLGAWTFASSLNSRLERNEEEDG